jgi:hypothetical protein
MRQRGPAHGGTPPAQPPRRGRPPRTKEQQIQKKGRMMMREVKEFKKLSLRLEVKDNTSAGEVSGETIVSNFFNFSNFSNF